MLSSIAKENNAEKGWRKEGPNKVWQKGCMSYPQPDGGIFIYFGYKFWSNYAPSKSRPQCIKFVQKTGIYALAREEKLYLVFSKRCLWERPVKIWTYLACDSFKVTKMTTPSIFYVIFQINHRKSHKISPSSSYRRFPGQVAPCSNFHHLKQSVNRPLTFSPMTSIKQKSWQSSTMGRTNCQIATIRPCLHESNSQEYKQLVGMGESEKCQNFSKWKVKPKVSSSHQEQKSG